jgi:crotonobetainyl-CoA:carnitine CoA-transferase CaiB-like acyl-CoA transferase
MSGLMSVTGEGPGRPPVKVGAPVADISAGVLGALGVVSALHARAATGRGQRVDASLFDAAVMLTFWQSAMALATGRAPQPMGTAHPLDAPYQAFEAADGWFIVGAANQANWERLADAIGRPDLARDPRFLDNPRRLDNLGALVAALTPVFRARPVAHWLAALEAAGVPSGPILSVPEMLEHPQVRARGMVTTTEHATLGPVASLGLPLHLSETPGGVRGPAPTLGQHTREVLGELGYADAEIERMIADGAAHAA